MTYDDIVYDRDETGVVTITINRPDKLNAFTAREGGGAYSTTAKHDVGVDIEDLHTIIRDIPKPVIAAANGYAIGGGHVLHVICDLTIAADHAGLYYGMEESAEGTRAFREKRPPDFGRFRK